MPDPTEIVRTYIRAKDGNRPLFIREAFAEDAELEMNLKTDAISFPNSVQGLEAITDVLIRRFAIDYANVFTFCLSRPSATDQTNFACHWLVGLSAKADGAIRVGCGSYDWHFASDKFGLVDKLTINIDVMNVLPKAAFKPIMDWLSDIPYPWCTPDEAVRNMPSINGLGPIKTYLEEIQP